MSKVNAIRALLIGNPNCGKTSIFNQLTGLNQRVGNFAGVTVEKFTGKFTHENQRIQCIDFPGTYSLYPRALDDSLVAQTLLAQPSEFDVILVVLRAGELSRSLCILTQIVDLGLPVIGIVNMIDELERQGASLNATVLSQRFEVPIVCTDARRGKGFDALKTCILQTVDSQYCPIPKPFSNEVFVRELAEQTQVHLSLPNAYCGFQYMQQDVAILGLDADKSAYVQAQQQANQTLLTQSKETDLQARHLRIKDLLKGVLHLPAQIKGSNLDKILVHKIWGIGIFLALLFLIFQLLFKGSEPFMESIEQAIGYLSWQLTEHMPAGILRDLISQGLLPGIGGVIVFVPQIAFLFFFLSLLEQSGYMARVAAMADKPMRQVGLNGRSLVPWVSGMACAIPSVMAARNIPDGRARLITILTVPLMSCAARLPVYTLLLSVIVPRNTLLGVFNLQGILLFSLYILGCVSSLGMAALLSKVLKKNVQGRKNSSFLFMELPPYRMPLWRNVFLTTYQKSGIFVKEAGKIIVAVSVILWALSTWGSGEALQKDLAQPHAPMDEAAQEALTLKYSYMGQLGRFIEPVIAPLGYDWKIGIALISSFAAREVFVGTLLIIYQLDSEDIDTPSQHIVTRLSQEKRPNGSLVFDLATCASLLVFYAFGMQCISTLAVVYRETKSWKWPLFQLGYMNVLAYVAAWVTYTILA